jgi:hypothetical protein
MTARWWREYELSIKIDGIVILLINIIYIISFDQSWSPCKKNNNWKRNLIISIIWKQMPTITAFYVLQYSYTQYYTCVTFWVCFHPLFTSGYPECGHGISGYKHIPRSGSATSGYELYQQNCLWKHTQKWTHKYVHLRAGRFTKIMM